MDKANKIYLKEYEPEKKWKSIFSLNYNHIKLLTHFEETLT